MILRVWGGRQREGKKVTEPAKCVGLPPSIALVSSTTQGECVINSMEEDDDGQAHNPYSYYSHLCSSPSILTHVLPTTPTPPHSVLPSLPAYIAIAIVIFPATAAATSFPTPTVDFDIPT